MYVLYSDCVFLHVILKFTTPSSKSQSTNVSLLITQQVITHPLILLGFIIINQPEKYLYLGMYSTVPNLGLSHRYLNLHRSYQSNEVQYH